MALQVVFFGGINKKNKKLKKKSNNKKHWHLLFSCLYPRFSYPANTVFLDHKPTKHVTSQGTSLYFKLKPLVWLK